MLLPKYRPDPSQAGMLDYNEKDDQIIGTICSYKNDFPESEIRILTNDTGPMVSAKTVDVKFDQIPDEWLLEPESSELEKENNKLLKEINKLKDTKLKPSIVCIDKNKNEIAKIVHQHVEYLPLSTDEINDLINRLKIHFPMESDFDREKNVLEKRIIGSAYRNILHAGKVYHSAPEDKIQKYKQEEYPEWIEGCKTILANLDNNLNKNTFGLEFCFDVRNIGTYPGKDVLVNIIAKGDLLIMPEENTESGNTDIELPILPSPPKPPQGKWTVQATQMLGSTILMKTLQDRVSMNMGLKALEINTIPPIYPIRHTDNNRDANQFYWKPIKPFEPARILTYKCDQWRHGGEPEYFRGIVYCKDNDENVSGAIELNIHAENLVEVVEKIIGVEIKVDKESAFKKAEEIIQNLIESCI